MSQNAGIQADVASSSSAACSSPPSRRALCPASTAALWSHMNGGISAVLSS